MTRREAQALVADAIDALIANDSVLLDVDIAERALSHQLAHYMALSIGPPLAVDCEYNRHSKNPKRMLLPRRKSSEDELRATTVFPDIIVHQRNDDRNNLIVLEVKKPGESLDYDQKKLQQFKDLLMYQHAAHVILGLDTNGNVVREVKWI